MKVPIAVAFLLVLVLCVAILILIPNKQSNDISIRHTQILSSNITIITFQITNCSRTDLYEFIPRDVLIRSSNKWTTVIPAKDDRSRKLEPKDMCSYTVNLTNVPVGTIGRFSIMLLKPIRGIRGVLTRLEYNMSQNGKKYGHIPLNPNDPGTTFLGGSDSDSLREEFVVGKTSPVTNPKTN